MDMSEEVSLFVSSTLDDMGHSGEMFLRRRKFHEKLKQSFEKNLGNVNLIYSENCVWFIKQHVSCSSLADLQEPNYDDNKVIIFESETDCVKPGYTRLKLFSGEILQDEDLLNSFYRKQKTESYYLWSICYFKKMRYKYMIHVPRSVSLLDQAVTGPGIYGSTDIDCVDFPLRFIDRKLGSKLQKRDRLSDWPTEHQLRFISKMDGFVVPSSSPDSESPHLEWKICYPQVEDYLFNTLNTIQMKLYILLEMLAKSTLQELSSDINSYVMRNIVFWMVYIYPVDMFHDRYLLLLVLTSLGLLYNGVKSRFIPCFITEERNLLSEEISVPIKRNLLETLSILRQEKACMFLRCEKLMCMMVMRLKSPHITDMYAKQRTMLEKRVLDLQTLETDYATLRSNGKTVQELYADYLHVIRDIFDMVYPEWKEHFDEDNTVQDTVIKRIREILT